MIGHATKVAFMFLCCVKTIKDVIITFERGLVSVYDKQEIKSIILFIISEITTLSKATIKAFPETEITTDQAGRFENILSELQTGKPVQYILGYTEFYGLKFLVNPSVLIPRPETEELVKWIINTWQLAVGDWQQPYNLLDIGTGSGCIAISLKKNLPDALVSAIDISADALKTAEENARINDVEINLIHADILNLKSEIQDSKFAIIVSNPPYVTLQDKEQMHINVTNFEPHTALFVPENDPLLFYRAIADYAINNLANDGLLFFEINESFGQETVQLLQDKGFKNIELKKDMSDRYRMIKAAFISNGSE
jgi:release factor glutamine methyltransferase